METGKDVIPYFRNNMKEGSEMFWRILKKDLKRKKTMNIILLLFIILCSMFAAAAVNNIIAVTGGIEHYFDAAGVPEAMVYIEGESGLEDEIADLPGVSEAKTEHWLAFPDSGCCEYNGRKLDNFIGMLIGISDKEMGINYFSEENEMIRDVEKGSFYATKVFTKDLDISVGDYVEFTMGETTRRLRYAGRLKGALFGNDAASNPFILFDSEDYDCFMSDETAGIMPISRTYVRTTDTDKVEEWADGVEKASFSVRETHKKIYLYDMFAAYIMLTISIVLMITAFVVLRFTIGFTISEEFREIGVMKAVGIGNGSIRSLYIIKYLALSLIGAAVGFVCSIPLTDAMLKTVSENMVLGSENSSVMGLLSVAAVVVIILLFCYGCTRSVKKLSPIDAVRNGETGERFKKKSGLRLGRSKLPATGFLSLNDVLSAPKRFGIITVVFTLCLLLITLMSNCAQTLSSDKLLWLFEVPECHAHNIDTEPLAEMMAGQRTYTDIIEENDRMLADNGIPGKCTMTVGTYGDTVHGDKKVKIYYSAVKGADDFEPRIDEGSAPQKNDEIAMTVSALEHLDAHIGDKVTADIGGKKYDFIITGRYSAFAVDSAFLYKDFDLSNELSLGSMGVQMRFDGDPDKETINGYIEKIKEATGSKKIYSSADFVKTMTEVSDTLSAIKRLMMAITVIVTVMIVILMERSFISKEKSEIALMKAIGITDGSVIGQHTLRFVIVSILACLLATAVLMPVSNWLMNTICLLIGDVSGIRCAVDPAEVLLIAPAILIGVTVIGSFLTALYTRTIKSADAAGIE